MCRDNTDSTVSCEQQQVKTVTASVYLNVAVQAMSVADCVAWLQQARIEDTNHQDVVLWKC